MILLNLLHDYDLLIDSKFIKVLHDSGENDMFYTISLVIYLVTLIPRLIGSVGLLHSVFKYYFRERGHIYREENEKKRKDLLNKMRFSNHNDDL